jgi:hypothetical protein
MVDGRVSNAPTDSETIVILVRLVDRAGRADPDRSRRELLRAALQADHFRGGSGRQVLRTPGRIGRLSRRPFYILRLRLPRAYRCIGKGPKGPRKRLVAPRTLFDVDFIRPIRPGLYGF